WTIASLPQTNLASDGNNGAGTTLYNLSIVASGCTADIYISANDDLQTSGGFVLGLGNETFCNSTSDDSVPGTGCTQITTSYDSIIGQNLGNGENVFLKFYLSVPGGQGAGFYNNSISIKGVKNGEIP
ncbi:MAG: hypothetical protein KKC05_03420, partial [Nanoarchaeota archaeon]|nr:hypothetical protein [Nanoarchaeota archaeon]